MFTAIRKRFTYTNVALTLALVFAMTGGAYAAKKYLITSTKQISPSVLKALAGKPGAAGAQGPAGPAGPQGPAGAAGAKGETGSAGSEGVQGKQGPTGAAGAKGTAGATGSTGPTGATGSPWVAGGTLPSGKTETGFWNISDYNLPEEKEVSVPLSFAIPLKEGSDGTHTKVLNKSQTQNGEGGSNCKGTAEEPTAAPGFLCVYTYLEENSTKPAPSISTQTAALGKQGYGPTGAFISILSEELKGQVFMTGTFAVTAP